MGTKWRSFVVLILILLLMQFPLFYKVFRFQLGFWIDIWTYISLAVHMVILGMVAIEIFKNEVN